MWIIRPLFSFIGGVVPEKARVVFAIPELRKKILLTLGLLAIYRVGWQIPLAIVDSAKMFRDLLRVRSLMRRHRRSGALEAAPNLEDRTH